MAPAAACDAALSPSSTWDFPATDDGTTADGRPYIDRRSYFIGRWLLCGGSGLSPSAHAGVEFGTNNRWRLLSSDPTTGALVPMDPTVPHSHGYYYALSSGQFNLYGEGPVDDLGAQYFYAKFTANMDALQFPTPGDPPTTGGYARITGPDFDGAANLPSMSDGRCSMAGTWDIPGYDMSPVEPPATITFDAQGNFVGYAQTDPPCSQSAMYGTYRLTPGMFQLTSNVGMGTCQWMQIAGYPAAFDASCDQLTLTRMYDNCTGGRGYFNGPTTVLRRE